MSLLTKGMTSNTLIATKGLGDQFLAFGVRVISMISKFTLKVSKRSQL